MDIKAQVNKVEKLDEYFFMVPDYQREYVWRVDHEVQQFLEDISAEFDPGAKQQSSYFIGSVILVKNGSQYEVIDGQQRLTTITLAMCAMRDLYRPYQTTLSARQGQYFKKVDEWLSTFDAEADEMRPRLSLQYEESKDFLVNLIQTGDVPTPDDSASILKMRAAYLSIKNWLDAQYLKTGIEDFTNFVRYFLASIELVVIESESISSALKIFETINQRGAGLNAMDLFKNLLFRSADQNKFVQIKEKWRSMSAHLTRAGEGDKPLRFLRYLFTARFHAGILREDELYTWIVSPKGKAALGYEEHPVALASKLEKAAKRYADLVVATKLENDGGDYPAVTRIGFINKVGSRLHLILLLALDENASTDSIEYLATHIESHFFFSNVIGIRTNINEPLFSQWAAQLRGLKEIADIEQVLEKTMFSYLRLKLTDFKQKFLAIKINDFTPLYRTRYVLGRMENTLLSAAGLPAKGLKFINGLQIEHILPQTPDEGGIPETLASDRESYQALVGMLGNATLLEGTINQAVNKCNDLHGNWFERKQGEYVKSSLLGTQLLDAAFTIGVDTGVNRVKNALGYHFLTWDGDAIARRQQLLLELALQTWTFSSKRLDAVTIPTDVLAAEPAIDA